MGSVPLPDAQPVVLPAEALPSEGGEVERHLASITISERVMEPDMRAIVTGEVCLMHTSAVTNTFIMYTEVHTLCELLSLWHISQW